MPPSVESPLHPREGLVERAGVAKSKRRAAAEEEDAHEPNNKHAVGSCVIARNRILWVLKQLRLACVWARVLE